MPKIEIVSKTPYVSVTPDRKLKQISFVVYKLEDGKVGAVVVDKLEPRPEDVEAAIKAREGKK